jgi:aryl carrier-like protein
MVPSHFVAMDAFPLTPNLKTDRRALPAPEQNQIASGVSYVAPEHELELKIAEIWQQVLNVHKVGVEDNFFDLGGHSVLVAQARSRLRKVVDSDVSLVDLFRFPTIRALAEHLSHSSNEGGAALVQRSVDRAKARREGVLRRRQRQRTRDS